MPLIEIPALNSPPPAADPPVLEDLTNRIKYTEEVRKRQKLDPSGATDDDLAQAVIEESKVACEIALQNRIDSFFDRVQSSFNHLDASLIRIEINVARSTNSSATRLTDTIVPVPNKEGVLPDPFPNTREELNDLSDADVDRLLNHYGLSGETDNDLSELSDHLGIR